MFCIRIIVFYLSGGFAMGNIQQELNTSITYRHQEEYGNEMINSNPPELLFNSSHITLEG